MPPEWRKKVQGERVYIAYKEKTGFSESSFITPVNSRGYFRNYAQDRDAAMLELRSQAGDFQDRYINATVMENI